MLISFLFLLPSLRDVGDSLFANHRYNEAIRIYEDALFWFKKARDKYGIGFVNYKLSNKEEARRIFQEIDDVYPLGVISYQKGRFKEATDYFKRADNSFFTAKCYYRLGEFRESEINYKKYLATGTRNQKVAPTYKKEALYGLAWSHYKLEDFSSSAKEFSEFITQYPEDELRYTCIYYTGRSFLKNGGKASFQLPILEAFLMSIRIASLPSILIIG